MPRKPAVIDKIASVDDFKTVLDTLCLDLAQANDHYALFMKLLEDKECAYTKAVSQSQTLWSLTYGAHFDAAVFRLCRAYDQDDGALSLRTLLETIKRRPAFLPKPTRHVDDADLEEALALASQETNPVVKHLMMWRHKVYFHRDVKKTISGRMADEYPVTHDDVAGLLDNGFKIVNRYNVVFFGTSFMQSMVGNDDYLEVLRTLQAAVEEIEADIQAQIKRAQEKA